jgi:hypothetical protein
MPVSVRPGLVAEMHLMQSMPARVHAIDRRYIRLSDPLLSRVEHLARLAGVTASDVVTFVLTEAFEDGSLPQPAPADDPPPAEPLAAPHRHPADVIAITRARSREPRKALECVDGSSLRRQAADLRGVAQAVRTPPAQTRHAADGARAGATSARKHTDTSV